MDNIFDIHAADTKLATRLFEGVGWQLFNIDTILHNFDKLNTLLQQLVVLNLA